MVFIAAFGLLMSLLSVMMIVQPNRWSQGIVNFANKPYFHWFEVISRFIAGSIFVLVSERFVYPLLILAMGCLLILVSLGLVIIGEKRHRAFAYWSATKFKSTFRPAGIASLIFGCTLVYLSIFAS